MTSDLKRHHYIYFSDLSGVKRLDRNHQMNQSHSHAIEGVITIILPYITIILLLIIMNCTIVHRVIEL